MNKQEVWKDVTGYEGLYKISNYGKIKALPKYKRLKLKKELKTYFDKDGYKVVYLYKHSKKKAKKIHRLVAEAFIPNLNNLPQVNHKDEDKQNNKVDNLEWCDAKYNANYGNCQSKKGKKIRKKINQYELNGSFIKQWESITEVANYYLTTKQSIISCCKGRSKSSKGYVWKYADNN